jgi:hypothetical protein
VQNFIEGTLPSLLLIGVMTVVPYLLRFIALYVGLVSEIEVTRFVAVR